MNTNFNASRKIQLQLLQEPKAFNGRVSQKYKGMYIQKPCVCEAYKVYKRL